MNHRNAYRKLNRTAAHRKAMFRNLATSLVLHNRIETTLPKAKELKRLADRLVTLGKKNSLHARRQAMAYLFAMNRTEAGEKQKWTVVHKLFTEIAPRYEGRNGGYTRVIRTRKRDGDRAQLALIEFVEADVQAQKPEKKRKRRVVKKTKAEGEASEARSE